MNKPKALDMNNQTKPTPSLNAALEAFAQKVEGRLHAYVKETHQGKPAISCIWSETPKKTRKDVVYTCDQGFDALAVVRAGNKGMKASEQVVKMLIELYESQNGKSVGEGIEF